MKRLSLSLLMVLMTTSCIELELLTNNKKSKKSHKSQTSLTRVSNDKDEDGPIDTRFQNKDVAGCLGEIAFFPVTGLIQALSNGLSKNKITLNFSGRIIKKVKQDLLAFIEENGEINPRDFWQALSNETLKKLNLEIIYAYSHLNNEGFNNTKREIAHAFLYYLQQNKKNVAYKFSFSGEVKGSLNSTSYFSFDGPNMRTEAIDASTCAYFRHIEIELDQPDFGEDVISKTICAYKKVNSIVVDKLNNDDLEVLVDSKNLIKNKFALNSQDILEQKSETSLKLKYSEGWLSYPKLELDFFKQSSWDKEHNRVFSEKLYKAMSLEIKHSPFEKTRFEDAKCRTFLNE